MNREEAEKKVLALCSAKWVEGSNDSDESKETAKIKQEIINALCADHSGDTGKMMSFEEFKTSIQDACQAHMETSCGGLDIERLRKLYDRMPGSCSTKTTVSPFAEIQGKWPGEETTEQLLDALKEPPVMQDAVKGGASFEFYVNVRELGDWSFMTVAKKPFSGGRKFKAMEVKLCKD